MTHRGLVCLLLGGLAWGQAAKPAAPPAATPQSSAAPMSEPAETKQPDPSKVAADAPVITIAGMCKNAPSDKASSDPNCKTVITKSEFEALLDAVAPNLPPASRRQLANRYATGLIMATQAEKMGLDKGPHYEEMLKISRMQVLAGELQKAMQEKAGNIPDADIQKYYDENKAAYEEADLKRIFVPKNKQLEAPKVKLTEEQEKKRQADAEAAMKLEADKLHARAVAGEDWSKLQEEAFQVAGFKAKAPSTDMGKIRRSGLPPSQAPQVFDLATGKVSPVIADTSGYFIYKMGEKDTQPLDKVKEEIHNTLRAQRMQDSMQAIQQSATPTLNDEYFGAEQAPGAEMMGPGHPPMTPDKPKAMKPPSSGAGPK
ncbi:MAG TPA: peptidylprolyl isomerase [Terriglobales bacterium]|nr:peptidylprolyl isomerase [Terriglobales bacterium]